MIDFTAFADEVTKIASVGTPSLASQRESSARQWQAIKGKALERARQPVSNIKAPSTFKARVKSFLRGGGKALRRLR